MNETWRTIPGYEGLYWINELGFVVNSDGHTLTLYHSKHGDKVELRRDGQRDKLFVKDLLKQVGFITEG